MEIKTTGKKTKQSKELIFSILDILHEVGVPLDLTQRRLERMAMACISVGDIKHGFNEAKSSDDGHLKTTREITSFINKYYGENISSGSYDDIRRKDLQFPVLAGIILNSASIEGKSTNNPTRGYALNPDYAKLLKSYDTDNWDIALKEFNENNGTLTDKLQKKRNLEKIPVKLSPCMELHLSYGDHNVLQKYIIEDFLPRFGMGAEIMYLGDASDKFLYREDEKLHKIGFFTLEHDELPDIVAYNEAKNLLFLIEAVHSTGPMDEVRVIKLKKQLENCKAAPIFITAFLNKKDFKKWVDKIAWESEVWIADSPDHMIHFNGYKFLEIHK